MAKQSDAAASSKEERSDQSFCGEHSECGMEKMHRDSWVVDSHAPQAWWKQPLNKLLLNIENKVCALSRLALADSHAGRSLA